MASEAGTQPQSPTASASRLQSLDVFRGITIAAMTLVNHPGDGRTVYEPLKHATWHGWTPTDFVFPFFLFIVGVAITLALSKRMDAGTPRRSLIGQIVRRSAIIFGLGLVLNGFPYYDLSTLRIPGVLQRIAVCYLVASLLYLYTGIRAQLAILLSLLIGYWGLLTLIPVPGAGAGLLTPEGNLSGYIDRIFLEGHMYRITKVFDPEGILSTLPSIGTVLLGILTGHWLKKAPNGTRCTLGLAAAGALLTSLGLAWDPLFPINKMIWTSSYALFTAGLALLLFAACYWLTDVRGYRFWSKPFLVFGMNAITVYVLSGLLSRVLTLIRWTDAAGGALDLKRYLYQQIFLPLADPINASLLWAISYVLLWLGIMWIFYHRRIFLRV